MTGSIGSCTHRNVMQGASGATICLDCGASQGELVRGDGPPASRELARRARERNDTFFEIQLEVAESSRDVRFGEADSGSRSHHDNAGDLAAIEAEGWKLANVGYVFVSTGQSSRQKVFGTGESFAVSGVVVGIYLFRSVDAPSSDSG